MKVTIEINSFDELDNQSWDGAKQTLAKIRCNGLKNELMEFLEMLFPNGTNDEELNDYLWFRRDEIYETLGIEY